VRTPGRSPAGCSERDTERFCEKVSYSVVTGGSLESDDTARRFSDSGIEAARIGAPEKPALGALHLLFVRPTKLDRAPAEEEL
jgi:hypothetical protein